MTDQYGPYTDFTIDPNTGMYGVAGTESTVPAPSWGVPSSQTTAVQSAASSISGSVTSTLSVLQQMLQVTGLDVPATVDYSLPPPGSGSDDFTKAFLTGVDPQQRAAAAALGQTLPQTITDDRVYMGNTEKTQVSGAPEHIGLAGPTDSELAGPGNTETKHKTTTVQAALNQPYLWSNDKVTETMKKMREAGINVTDFDTMMNVWQSLVTRASRTFVLSDGENLVTPWDMLSATKKENIANGTLDKNGNIVHTSTSTSVNTLSEGQAWETLRATVQDMLGRDPSDQEVRDFLSMANSDAAKDPSKTVSTTHTDTESGQSNTTSHTTGGYTSADAARSAYDQTHDTAEYADYQAAGPLFNTLLSALGEVAGSG
jgi:hypothetical protein